MLTRWLASSNRPADDERRFAVADVAELGTRDHDVEEWLAEKLRDERLHPDLVQDLVDAVGWTEASELVRGTMPSLPNVRKGVLGELLAAACAVEFDGLVIPVKKLRSMLASGQSLPGTDILAFQVGEDNVIEGAHYIEAKLRIACDLNAAVSAEKQLADDIASKTPGILLFVMNQVHEAKGALEQPLREYLHRRAAGDEVDDFRIHLTWEDAAWSEEVLTRLADEDEMLAPLSVCVARIEGLERLIHRVYESVGFEVKFDDD